MVLLFAIALSIYALINLYIGRRGAQALAAYPTARAVFLVLFIALALAFPLGRILMTFTRSFPSPILLQAGSFELAVMLYGFLAVVLVDLVRLVNAFVPFLPRSLSAQPGRAGLVLFLVVAGGILVTLAAGAVNAARIRTVDLDLTIPRGAGTADRLTMVMASDLHLGTLVGRTRLEKIVDMANALAPDIIVFAGDIVDETVTGEIEAGFSAVMRKLRAPLGVFAAPGNHEFYSGLERNLACLRSCGVTVLQDEAVEVAGALILVGRRDPSSLGVQEVRLSIGGILAKSGLEANLPMVVLDHQPVHLEEAEQAGVALQLSGHTHAGQLFPLDIVNGFIYELNWGQLRRGNTHYYVTSGAGTWGPPVRTASRAEIVRVRLTFAGPS